MKITARSATQVPGYGVVQRGRTIDWPDGVPFPPQVLGNFTNAADGTPLENPAAAAPGKTADGSAVPPQSPADKADAALLVKRTAAIGRVKLAAKLDSLHVPYDEKMTATDLAKILLRHNGEKID